jgi:hypothetical protein
MKRLQQIKIKYFLRQGSGSLSTLMFLSLAIAACTTAVSENTCAVAPNSRTCNMKSALKMVESTRLGDNLITMCGKKLSHTQTYKDTVNSIGADAAHQNLDQALKKVLPEYQHEWNKNLAESYLDLLTREEMESIAALQEKSPYVNKMLVRSNQAGPIMQKNSEQLFNTACDAVRQAAFPAN